MRIEQLTNAIVIGALVCAVAPVLAQDMEELEVDHALTFDFATPHTDWAQPYAGGKTRVLFFVNGRGTHARQCVELMQRFDIEAEAVFWVRIIDSSESNWLGAGIGERRMMNLLEKQWDCFVFLGLNMANMSPEQQVKLLKPVAEGAGLVFLGSNDKRVLKAKNRLAELPVFLGGGPKWAAYTVGTGRGVRIPTYARLPYSEEWQILYDYEAEQIGRAILWAARKEPACSLEFGMSGRELVHGAPATVQTRCMGVPLGDDAIVVLRVRGMSGDVVPLMDAPIAAAARVPLPLLTAGKYHLDGWIRSSNGVEAWATLPFSVTSTRRVAELTLDRAWGEIGDALTGTVVLEGAASEAETVRVRLLDRRRRVLVRQDFEGAATSARFTFAVEEWMPMLLTVEALVLDDADVVDRSYVYFQVTKRHRGKFNFLMWDAPQGTLAPYAEENLARHSVTLQLGRRPPLICSAFDVAWVPYTTRILSNLGVDGVMKPFCWNDEAKVAKHLERLTSAYACARRHGTFVWSLGDEVDTKGACLSPHCARVYREYLRQEYPTLQALNASWGTSFAAWSDVGLSAEDDPEEATSFRAGNYPRWFDRQAYKSWNFVQFCRKYAKAYSGIDPKAMTGFEGAGRFEEGDDIDLIVRHNTFWSPYPGTVDEVIRSIAPRDFPRSNWMGYTKDADTLLRKYWRMVTRGMDAVWWWRWEGVGRFHGWLAPDLRPYQAVVDILQDTQVVRDGLGDLLLRYPMQDDGIAVLYSYPSTFAHKLGNGSSFSGCENAHLGVHGIVRDLGLQFLYVTDRMLRLGEFDPSTFKVLILARVDALGDREAAVIRRFVENGGTVIADVRSGVFDGHCKSRANGVLDDLFGIRRQGLTEAKVVKDEVFGTLHLDAAVELAGGVADAVIDDVPIFIRKGTGAGRTLLLNFSFANYPGLHLPDTPERAAVIMADVFKKAGVVPRVSIVGADGARERHLETTRWLNGDVEVLSLFRQEGKASDVTVVLPEEREVYDLRNRVYLGRQKSFAARIIADRAGFFALCTSQAPKAKLKVSSRKVRRGSVLDVTLSVKRAGNPFAFRVGVQADGQELEWLQQNVIVGRQSGKVRLPIAFNDPVGTYTIRAVELFSGNETKVGVKVGDR